MDAVGVCPDLRPAGGKRRKGELKEGAKTKEPKQKGRLLTRWPPTLQFKIQRADAECC